MARSKSVERQAFWRRLLERHATSGMSVARFCARAGVSTGSFYRWQRELRQPNGKLGGENQEGRESADARTLLPVRVLSEPSTQPEIEVAWPGGIVVRIWRGCDVPQLREVLRIVQQFAPGGGSSC
jgi:transposase-like protein